MRRLGGSTSVENLASSRDYFYKAFVNTHKVDLITIFGFNLLPFFVNQTIPMWFGRSSPLSLCPWASLVCIQLVHV